jgi:dihydroorotate dehydrogenase (fumarate)
MDLSTTYLGMRLRSPLVPSASPLSEKIDNIKRMEDAGAAAVVLHSLFEEQLAEERRELHRHLSYFEQSFTEALSFFPEPTEFRLGPEAYLEHIRKAKAATRIPVIASLNGTSPGGWLDYVALIQQAGADAIELNLYYLPTDVDMTSAQVEQTYIDFVEAVKAAVTIPVAVKLGPFFSNLAHMAERLDWAGADALVLFNRFYQPEIDLDKLEVRPHMLLSTPQSLRLPMRWIAILYGRIRAGLAATGGIHQAEDALKLLMAGANVTMLCSTLMIHGLEHIRTIEQDMLDWMDLHEYESVREMQGSMSHRNCADPAAFERVQYVRALQSYKPSGANGTR